MRKFGDLSLGSKVSHPTPCQQDGAPAFRGGNPRMLSLTSHIPVSQFTVLVASDASRFLHTPCWDGGHSCLHRTSKQPCHQQLVTAFDYEDRCVHACIHIIVLFGFRQR